MTIKQFLFGPLFFLTLLTFHNSFGSEKITLLVGEWPPFIGKKLKDHGFGSRIIKRAFEKKDIKVKLYFTTWKNAFEWTKKGKKGNGTFFWSKTERREKDFLFSIPTMVERNVFFHLKRNKIRWRKMRDLRFKKMGTVKGFSYGKEFDAAIRKNLFKKVVFGKTSLQNFKNLLEGKIDLFPHEISVAHHELQENFPKYKYKKIIFNEKEIGKDYTYLLMSKRKKKKSLKLLKDFNESLAEMLINGEYHKMFHQE
jgi:polar amino acid transport system substrate-binding protein